MEYSAEIIAVFTSPEQQSTSDIKDFNNSILHDDKSSSTTSDQIMEVDQRPSN